MGLPVWKEIDIQDAFNIDLNKPSTVRDYNKSMQYDFQKFGMQQALKFGVPRYLS
jgi:hypothetical protein